MKLGCETVDMYDLFGNKTTLSSADGVYNITVNDTLVYLAGDFTTFEEASASISMAEEFKSTADAEVTVEAKKIMTYRVKF